MSAAPAPPERVEPPAEHPRRSLWLHVREALLSLPAYFAAPDIRIVGVRATEIVTLGAVLGATIEDQVVTTLNRMRQVWDPDEEYPLFSFVRQPQTFPDVLLLQRRTEGPDIALGIELKGWYLLAKEGEPNFRYSVTPAACTEWDLVVVVPWFLSDVISGTPKVLQPFIESARFAAEYRNYWWRHVRRAASFTEVRPPEGPVTPYPRKSDHILDRPVEDAGGNFGRLARAGVMDAYKAEMLDQPIAGIAAKYWLDFFRQFQERVDQASVARALERMARTVARERPDTAEGRATEILARVLEELRGAGG